MSGPQAAGRRGRSTSLWLALPIAVLVLWGVQAAWDAVVRGGDGPRWIWDPRANVVNGPAAFFALRDFKVQEPVTRARITIRADETYLIYLNGGWVGGGRFRRGAPANRYDITARLVSGRNRLIVELHSSQGAGGLLAVLEMETAAGLERVVTDGRWQVVREQREGLLTGRRPVRPVLRPVVWGPPGTGRWAAEAREPRDLPDLADLGLPGRSFLASRFGAGPAPRFWPRLGRRPSRPPLGSWVTFSWPERVHGFLNLAFASTDAQRGLLYFGSEPPDPRSAGADAHLVKPPGRDWWSDVEARSFRYVTVLGAAAVSAARVMAVDRDAWPLLFAPPRVTRGVLGVDPPASMTPMEYEVWRELEGVPGIGGGEEG